MILQALAEYYERKSADPENRMAPMGWEWKEIPFVLVINVDGKLVCIEDTRTKNGKFLRANEFLVPQTEKRTVGIRANLLWDNIEYSLGANSRKKNKEAGQSDSDFEKQEDKQTNKVNDRFSAFKNRIAVDIKAPSDTLEYKALMTFLNGNPAESYEKEIDRLCNQIVDEKEREKCRDEYWNSNPNVIFRMDASVSTLCDYFRSVIDRSHSAVTEDCGLCLITGKSGELKAIHPAIKNVRDAQSSGAALISFNKSSFCSYGKEQNLNAPAGATATFAYTTALNHLLQKDSTNKVYVGDATIVFWASKSSKENGIDMESLFSHLFQEDKDNPDAGILSIRSLLTAVHSGKIPHTPEDRFHVLGLAPNAARISVRNWKTGTICEFAEKISLHFEDLEIVRSKKDPEFLSLGKLLAGISLEFKVSNLAPNLAGDVVRAVLNGTRYPETLLQQCVRRIRAEQSIFRSRAAILKACLNRKKRFQSTDKHKEITVALDPNNQDIGYLLGRLFAVLERCQERAQGNLNASIRERYYGAFSSTPVTVMPLLMKLNKHHLAKLENPGEKVNLDKLLGEVMMGIDANIPSHLPLEEQARFAVGYYHQRQSFFKSKTDDQVQEQGE